MLSRFNAKDFATVAHYLGSLLLLTGLLMLIPVAVSVVFDEHACAVQFFFSGALSCLVGALLHLFKPLRLDRRRSLLLCGVSWVVIAFFAAIPLYLSGDFHDFLNAFFDSVSAITSTGVTALQDIDHISYGQATWRVVLSLSGGQAIIVIALYLGFFGEGGYSASDNARARQDSTLASLRQTGRSMWKVLAIVLIAGTVVTSIICAIKGLSVPDAIVNGFWLSGTAFSTGSFVPHGSNLIFYHSTMLNAVLAVLMIMGALNFAFLSAAVSPREVNIRSLLRNSELRAYALWLIVLIMAVTAILCRDSLYTTIKGLFNSATFMVVSAATTSGLQTVYPGQMGVGFPDGAFIIVMAAMFVGGCSCSTAGGIKMYRSLQVLRWFGLSIKRNLFPDSVQVNKHYYHFGRKQASSSDATLAMVITTLFIIATVLGAVTFIAHGHDALDAICESISFVTNTGIVSATPAWEMTFDLKIAAMLLMWMGRLEFVALIAVVVSLIASLKPRFNDTPEGVMNTRKSQRRERRRERIERLKRRLGVVGSSGTKALWPLVVVLLAGALAASPSAGSVAVAASSQTDVLQGVGTVQERRNVGVSELLSATERMDESYIEVTGEVVGAPIRQGNDRLWVNIRDDDGGMVGVVVRQSQIEKIEVWGGYCKQGDTVQVTGVYHRACNIHADELDIHASKVKVTEKGETWTMTPSKGLLARGLLMAAIAAALVWLERVWRGKKRLSLRVLR